MVVVVVVAQRTIAEVIRAAGMQVVPRPSPVVLFRFMFIVGKYKTKFFNIQICVINRKEPTDASEAAFYI